MYGQDSNDRLDQFTPLLLLSFVDILIHPFAFRSKSKPVKSRKKVKYYDKKKDSNSRPSVIPHVDKADIARILKVRAI